jgi:hypothetical protein
MGRPPRRSLPLSRDQRRQTNSSQTAALPLSQPHPNL